MLNTPVNAKSSSSKKNSRVMAHMSVMVMKITINIEKVQFHGIWKQHRYGNSKQQHTQESGKSMIHDHGNVKQ